MKPISTVAVAAFFATLGLTTFSLIGTAAAQGNIGPYAHAIAPAANIVAQAPASAAPAADASTAPAAPSSMTGTPAMDFGSPPSSKIPILFNDHHVYAKPDKLEANRVLAAIVKGSTILVPMRSMFEQMGATVAYDNATKTVDVSKPGSDVKVTVGKSEVLINGESRPLDVAPELVNGTVMVPLRVLSEGMGAYVQWVPDKRLVVIRYVTVTPPQPPTPAPATPEPTVTTAPTQAPTPAPTATPAPKKISSQYERFVVGDYLIAPKVYNEFSPGNTGKQSYRIAGAIEFALFNLPWMLEGDYRVYRYNHNISSGIAAGQPISGNGSPCASAAGVPTGEPGCVEVIGGTGEVYVPAFTARDQDFEGRFGLKIADPRIYVGVGYIYREDNYGYPKQTGVGFGVSKLPDLDSRFSIYTSAFYYPSVSGVFTDNTGNQFRLAYRLFKYAVGGTLDLASSPLYLDFGYQGEKAYNKENAPSEINISGPYAGLGIHF